jgi:hypothetical protein
LVPEAVPHALPLGRVSPTAAATVWLAALALRVVLALGLALSALLVLPATGLFDRVAGWSWHVFAGPPHLHLSGEPIAHAAALGPVALIALSLLGFAVALLRGALALRGELGRRALGRGPRGSLVIADRSLLVAVPGVGPGRIVLSDRALGELDRAELEACLAHEDAHLGRCHRSVGVVAAGLAVIARAIPGTRAAERGLRLSLERDADECAVARTGDPLALASAICKVAAAPAGANARGPIALGLVGGGGVRARLDGLLAGGRTRGSAGLERLVRLLGVGLSLLAVGAAIGLTLWLAAIVPPAAPAAAFACSG